MRARRCEDRGGRVSRFLDGSARFLVNVGVATEGTDLPRCSCVAVVRPTMSRALFVQMVGRGTRLYPGKADCLLLNFVPSNARHRLVAPIDVLAGGDPSTAAHARELATAAPDAPLHEIAARAEEAAPQRACAARLARYEAILQTYDPFGLLGDCTDLGLALHLDAEGAEVPGARDAIERMGIPADLAARCSPGLASALHRGLVARRRAGLCSFRIARQLARRGLNPNVSAELGKLAMEALAANQWRSVPASLRTDPRFALPRESDAA
jgi:hypothetical protein